MGQDKNKAEKESGKRKRVDKTVGQEEKSRETGGKKKRTEIQTEKKQSSERFRAV